MMRRLKSIASGRTSISSDPVSSIILFKIIHLFTSFFSCGVLILSLIFCWFYGEKLECCEFMKLFWFLEYLRFDKLTSWKT